MERRLTCIICPRGCDLTVGIENKKIIYVTGNACPRGERYADDECTAPKRSVTSTVRCKSGALAAVKTSTAIPKEMVFDCMKLINSTVADDNVKIGDVLVKNLLGTNADLVVTGKPSV